MKQIIQDLKNGITKLEEVPAPAVKPGCILVKTSRTLVSLGTERMLVEFGRASLVEKARQQPERVKQVLDKMRTDGIMPTLEAVFNKLNQPLPLGYCNAGRVIAVGAGAGEFHVGDRVASNGGHAEFVCVPKNLAAKIPDSVSDDEAAFTVISSIALQGIRNLNPQFGETVVVIGLGLIGIVAAQLLRANGCRVIGSDFDLEKIKLAESFGVQCFNSGRDGDFVNFVENITGGTGADGVLITASSSGDDIIHQACLMSRKRGRIVLVGVVGMNMRRDDFYKKELSFQVSCSYGAGRYDDDYENKGIDYPLPYVRWTEKRNFETVLYAMESGTLNVKPLISETVELKDYMNIYGNMRKTGIIASLMKFPEDSKLEKCIKITDGNFNGGPGCFGIIGAGNFASSTIVPCLKSAGARIKYISSAQGLHARILAEKAGAGAAASDPEIILKDPDVSTVIVCTRHNLHARFVKNILAAGKNVFVEKPLCLNAAELEEIEKAYTANGGRNTITVGFNRRFAPLAVKMKQLSGRGPKNIVATMNAGFIPPDSWVHDPVSGGGRIIGEACHFIDLCSYIADSRVCSVFMNALGPDTNELTDNASIVLQYENGSNAVVNYFSNGSKAYPKERIEVFAGGSVLVLDNWRSLKGYGVKGFSSCSNRLDKGHKAQFALLKERTEKGGVPVIPFESIKNTTLASFAAIESLKTGKRIEL
ncbi:MAG: bi-domain-containing oxidoreductase [Elusimicrobiales bacterium]|nr:bi-domain-containing oxidoreductase [Elusimicrobiales bacterium]